MSGRRGRRLVRWRRRATFDPPHQRPFGIEELERQGLRLLLQLVADARALGTANDVGRFEQLHVGRARDSKLPESRDVIHDVKTAAMRANGNGVAFDYQIGDGDGIGQAL